MASIDNALTTLSRAKTYLGISVSTYDSLLTILIISVSKFVESYTRRQFKRQAYSSQLYDGRGSTQLTLKNYPVISGQTFTLQRRTAAGNEDGWETIDSEDYYIKYASGIIVMPGGFSEGVQNFRVTYTAGYYLPSSSDPAYQDGTDDDLDLPYDLEIAVLDLLQGVYNITQDDGVTQEQARDLSISYSKKLSQDATLKASLDQYKRHRF